MFYFQPVLVECVCKNVLTMEQIWMKRTQFSPPPPSPPPNQSAIFYGFLKYCILAKGNSKSLILIIKLADLKFWAFLRGIWGRQVLWREKIRSCSELSSRRSYLFQRLWKSNRKTSYLIYTLQFQARKLCGWIPFKNMLQWGYNNHSGGTTMKFKNFHKSPWKFQCPTSFSVLSYKYDVFRGSSKYRNGYYQKK